ncbi:cell division protein FtsL [Bacillus marinisedimentorum]|uniref:cell division protein FtsL n=1 Tax=Bacillus marinisedimentorum TaxID=1821260 RepID=UPI0008727411|nr:cell division protein FtsL [Bacillus marinisedimentorum]
MSNLAYEIQQKQQQQQRERHQQKQQRVTQPVPQRKKGITLGEKLLALGFAVILAFSCFIIVSNYATLYSVNKDIQQYEAAIDKQQKVNNELELSVAELNNPERIWEIAKKNGLTLNGDNVKVVQD